MYSAAPPSYEAVIVVPANHIEMTKFHNREDQNYQNVLAELKRIIAMAKERNTKGQTTGKNGKDDDDAQYASVKHVGNNTHGALANYGRQDYTGDGIHYGTYKVALFLRQSTHTFDRKRQHIQLIGQVA